MKTNIYTQHSDHTEWLNKLSFYKDEIKILQKSLDEVSTKNTAQEVRKDIEHFQNQIFIQENTIHTIRQHIEREERSIQADILKNPVSSDHRKTEDHTEERRMVNEFERDFNSLRQEFKLFVAKWL